MIEILRDPVWNGIAAMATILALIIAISQDKSLKSITFKFFTAVIKASFGIFIISLGVLLQSIFEDILMGGINSALNTWQEWIIQGIFGDIILAIIIYAIFPGSITALISSRGKTYITSAILATITVILATFLADIVTWLSDYTSSNIFISFISDLAGGLIAGPIIAGFIKILDNILA